MSNANIRNIDVLITPDANCPGGVAFSMPNADLKFHNDGKDGFMVYFNIQDPANTGYRFPDDRREAMWVEKMEPGAPDACPMDYSYWPEFKAKEVMNDNTTLRVRNLNHDKFKFGFTLRFTKNPTNNGPCIPYDPIGDNQNGNWSKVTVVTGTAAALAGGAIGAMAASLTNQAATTESIATGAAIGALVGLAGLFVFGRGGSPKAT